MYYVLSLEIKFDLIWSVDGQIYTRNHFIFMNKRWDMLQAQSEGPGFKSRRRRLDSCVRQAANRPCLSRLSCIMSTKCSYDAHQSMVEPPQRPSAGAMGHHSRCFARSISSQRAIKKKIGTTPTPIGPVRLAQLVERSGSQSEGPGFKSRRRRLDSSVRQTANGSNTSVASAV